MDPVGLPQITDVPHSLRNGDHSVSSIAQPPLNQSGPGRPSFTGTVCPAHTNDASSVVKLIS